ncbi:hypothetical protein WOLCODRAFT_140552 [Wolfiporia cocos MD-104 SS10]|uniref:Uncharacterized protein n=1 Tax=Wolfiporia cocos (strain MD-104) TaxID=742152 RepID=A0A2H3J3C0_WOLCO|nr:hypothetical protein WOLCODRAFT_140552 [Wolfiporia cocos MD-104 SS10]
MQPPPSSSNSTGGRPFPIYWSQVPSIKIIRQPKGRYSPAVDERCFTYCSQTARGRTEGREPWCRTVCVRHVFAHEVTRAFAAHKGQQPQSANNKIPLPPEGQHIPTLADILIGETREDGEEPPPEDVRHWEEGYYLWLSKSRWATQEKLDLMMNDLERQSEWQRYKERMTEQWEQQERQRQLKANSPAGASDAEAGAGEPQAESQEEKPASSAHTPDAMPSRRPFPDLAAQSILLPLPPPFPPIQEQVRNLLAPAHRLLNLTHESVHSGAQWKLVQRLWEKAFTEEPFVLARNVCSRMWENWKKGPPDDSL